MKIILPLCLAALFTACDARVEVPATSEKSTTIVTPGSPEKKVENNTTVVNPPAAEKKVESNTTVVNPPAGGGTVESSKSTTTTTTGQ